MQYLACGQAGMREPDFWDCELREVWNRINGFFAARLAEQKNQAELVRLQTAAILQAAARKGRRIKPADVWQFPWDNGAAQKEIRIMSPEERRDPKADAFIARLKNDQNGT